MEQEVVNNEAGTSSLTDWGNEPTLADLKEDFSDAQSDHDSHVGDVNTWLDNLNMTGSAAVPKVTGRSSISPKLIRKQAEWRYAALTEPFLSTDTLFDTSPVTFEDKKSAVQNGLILNNQFNTKVNKTKFIDEFIRTAVDEGTVILRTGWDFTEGTRTVSKPSYRYTSIPPMAAQEFVAKLKEVKELQQSNPNGYNTGVPDDLKESLRASEEAQKPVRAEVVGYTEEEETYNVENKPTVEICEYTNTRIDPSCLGDIDKAKFVTYSFETSKADLQADGKYTNLDEINLTTNNNVLGDPDYEAREDTDFTFKDEPRSKFVATEYWGYWDIEGDGVLEAIVATWVGETLIRMERNPFPDQKLPFVVVQYLPKRGSIYGEPDGALLEDNQKVIGAVTRGMIDIMGRSANGQLGSRKDALDVTNRRKFEKGQDYEFNATVDPRQAFHMHTYPEIPQAAQYMLNMQNSDAESLTGANNYSGGMNSGSLGSVATGIRGALDAASKRELGILRRLVNGLVQVGRKFISMNSEFLDETEVVRITNNQFVQIDRDDLAGNIDVSLTVSTAEADNKKAEELAFMLQTTGPNSDPGEVRMIRAEIATLRKMPTLAKKIEDYRPEPDPLTQKKMEMEMQLLEMQIAKERSMAIENEANARLYEARILTEQARARHYDSDSDLKDLDYVETESGTKQERTLQSMSKQTEGNVALKVAESRLKGDT